jgi:type II secretory pathway component PulJ
VIARSRSESGVTILEVVVSMSLISIVSAVFLPVLDTATRSVRPLQAQSVAVDDLRSSLAMIGRELRSALCITQPSANGPSGNVLQFTTEANNQSYEVTYTVNNGTLLRQVTGQSQVILVGTGLTGQNAAFTYFATPRRTVKVDFTYQPDATQPGRELSTVMTGRNAWSTTAQNCP